MAGNTTDTFCSRPLINQDQSAWNMNYRTHSINTRTITTKPFSTCRGTMIITFEFSTSIAFRFEIHFFRLFSDSLPMSDTSPWRQTRTTWRETTLFSISLEKLNFSGGFFSKFFWVTCSPIRTEQFKYTCTLCREISILCRIVPQVSLLKRLADRACGSSHSWYEVAGKVHVMVHRPSRDFCTVPCNLFKSNWDFQQQTRETSREFNSIRLHPTLCVLPSQTRAGEFPWTFPHRVGEPSRHFEFTRYKRNSFTYSLLIIFGAKLREIQCCQSLGPE